ncbi:MAG: ankyrin repeat domain-containing protein [Alphaproteobacteria bacterium]|nr:ankyrin repeat domain-containing protein [Alphaproteobacteria bacterium]
MKRIVIVVAVALALGLSMPDNSANAQVPPSPAEAANYTGLHAAAWVGDVAEIRRLAAAGAEIDATDKAGRTPLHVAAFASHEGAVEALAELGADTNRLENDKYDIITIAAVADDPEMVRLATSVGGNSANVTSIYDGTALIAAAHLGHVEVVQALIAAKAPLDHINNLGWTALLEAVILGDGGPRHVATARALVEAGADGAITDRQGSTPLDHARRRGYTEMIALLEAARSG